MDILFKTGFVEDEIVSLVKCFYKFLYCIVFSVYWPLVELYQQRISMINYYSSTATRALLVGVQQWRPWETWEAENADDGPRVAVFYQKIGVICNNATRTSL